MDANFSSWPPELFTSWPNLNVFKKFVHTPHLASWPSVVLLIFFTLEVPIITPRTFPSGSPFPSIIFLAPSSFRDRLLLPEGSGSQPWLQNGLCGELGKLLIPDSHFQKFSWSVIKPECKGFLKSPSVWFFLMGNECENHCFMGKLELYHRQKLHSFQLS